MLFVGIDISKSNHSCYIIDSEGTIYENNLQILNNLQGFKTLSQKIHSICQIHNYKNVKIGLESTGHYSTNITNYLYSEGFEVIIFNPIITNNKRKGNTLRKTKTDKTDAKVIATMLFTDRSKSYSPISYQIIELKSLTRYRHRMVKQRSKFKLSYTRLITIIFPELADHVSTVHQKSIQKLFFEFPTAKAIASCHLTKLTNLLKKNSKGKYLKDKAIELKELASKSIGSSNRATAFELQQTIKFIQFLNSEINIIDQKIKDLVDEIKTPLITIPGIGYTLAATIIAEIGDINRFSKPSKLLAFSGLDPSVYQSGKYDASHTMMVKRGSKYLRWAILQAARTVTMRDKTFKDYLNKKLSEGKHYFVALSHVGKKLIRVIFYLLKKNIDFVPQN
ncbi:IS110 family transposase [Halanaerobiaceae bacterium Z-7014]|uniref:IS110 family transposase n=1 Tax=Halonatronomonas betaini TaxID=2778430 RepID=A0A931AUK3_9FIRM|nr:IS110 family transposase [Halonatronomonas betaini]MBF8438216.1 IS110 family transposase [Halonatronomonas betaini]